MPAMRALRFRTGDDDGEEVSALLMRPEGARALFVLGHGAGAGMHHPFMEAAAVALAAESVATLRYQFPYMEQGRRMPNGRPMLLATVRAAAGLGAEVAEGLPLFAGGKSMGGRMTSLAAAETPLPGVDGLVFVGFPLHAAGRPSSTRAEHLAAVGVPMLFLQGTRDKLADLTLLAPIVESQPAATMHVVDGADHGFNVLKRSGRTDEDVRSELARTTAAWIVGQTAR